MSAPETTLPETPQEKAPKMHPSLWPYLILLIVLIVGWLLIVHFGWKPDFLTTQSGTLLNKLGWFVLPPSRSTQWPLQAAVRTAASMV